MKILLLILGLSFSQATFAGNISPKNMPTIDISGVAHYIADYDEHRNIWLDSSDGFCVLQGYSYASMVSSYVANVGPLAVLDKTGKVVSTHTDNANGQYSVAASITCN